GDLCVAADVRGCQRSQQSDCPIKCTRLIEGYPLRTNIVLDDNLIREAQKLTDLPTKKAVVDEALRTLIRLKKQETILSLRGKIHWRGDLKSWRVGRPSAGNH